MPDTPHEPLPFDSAVPPPADEHLHALEERVGTRENTAIAPDERTPALGTTLAAPEKSSANEEQALAASPEGVCAAPEDVCAAPEGVRAAEQQALASSEKSAMALENRALAQSATEETQLPPAPSTARLRGRRSLPDSPLERAKLEAQTGTIRTQDSDRSTMVAFGLLFVVPVLIILLSLLLLLPFINSQLTEDPSGVDTQSISRGQTPSR